MLSIGSKWAEENGYLWESDLEVLEENGCIDSAVPDTFLTMQERGA